MRIHSFTIPIVLLFLSMLLPNAAWTANHFIVAGGTGAQSGTDWNNALPDLPASPVCGDSYFFAGGTYNYTAVSHTISSSCTSGSPLLIYKAVSGGPGNPQNVAGWQASYGTNQAVFSQTDAADPELSYGAFFNLTGTYITIDGVVPTSGTPSKAGYGIRLHSTNNVQPAFIPVSGANNTIKHVEFDGGTENYGYQVTACSRTSGVVTATLSTSPRLVIGDHIDMVMAGGTPADFSTPSSGSGVALTSVSGTQIQYAQAGSNETCSVVTATHINPNYPFQTPYEANITANPGNLTLTDNYIHDIPGNITMASCYYCTFLRNYQARNFSTPTQHGQAIQGPNLHYSSIGQSIFEDIVGTGFILPTCGGSCNWLNDAIYSNVFFCTNASITNQATPTVSPQCGTSAIISDDNGANEVTNLLIYGNTFIRPYSCHIYVLNAASTATFENNLMYCSQNPDNTGFVGLNSPMVTHDYNSVWAQSTSLAPSPGPHDRFVATMSFPSLFVDPSDTGENFSLLTEAPESGCTSGTNCIKDGLTLGAPYNVDLLGITRGTDGTWERGAFEFNSGGSPNPPTNLIVNGVQ